MSDKMFTKKEVISTNNKLVLDKESNLNEYSSDHFEESALIVGALLALYGHTADHDELKKIAMEYK